MMNKQSPLKTDSKTKIFFVSFLFLVFAIAQSIAAEGISLEAAAKDMLSIVEEKLAGSTKDTARTIAIYHFTEDDVRTKLGDYAASEIATFFTRTKNRNIKILSRKKMDDILAEHEFQLSDLTDASKSGKIGKILNAGYIITGYIFTAKESFRLNIQMINIETAEILAGNSYTVTIDATIAGLIGKKTDETVNNTGDADKKTDATGVSLKIPEYVYTDTFDNFDTVFWKDISKSDEIEIKAKNGRLSITGKYREGRLNSINSFTSIPFKVQSFVVEISFRDVLLCSDAIILSVENTEYPFFAGTGGLSMVFNLRKEYYKFSWFKDGDWHFNEDALKYELFNDEDKKFHRLKLVFDLEVKTACGYLDDVLIDTVRDFQFKRSDKIDISVEVHESVSDTKKDVNIELDDFKSSIKF